MKSLERKLVAGIAIISILLTIAGVVLYAALTESNYKAAEVEHSNEVLTELEATLSILKDGETGQRGYIITGQDIYLEPFREADQHAGEKLARLKMLTESSDFHREQIIAAEPLIESKFELMRRTIKLRHDDGFEAAQKVIETNQGKNIMDAIRRVFAKMETYENSNLNEVKAASEARVYNVIIAFTGLFALIFTLFVLVYIFVRRDIAERNRLAAELQMIATTDELTGVFNRREANRLLKQEMSRSRRFHNPTAIMLLDIDHFKSVNDTYGHQTGDEVLKWFAEKISADVRKVDLTTRFGGEEFMVILPETNEKGALVIAERIRRLIAEQPFADNSKNEKNLKIPITVSIGVAEMKADDSESDLIKSADDSLYRAKTIGRNRVIAASTQAQNHESSLLPASSGILSS